MVYFKDKEKLKDKTYFLYCCFSDFPNSYNISISNKQKMAEL